MSKLVAMMAVLVLAAACGGTKAAGDSCSPEGSGTCSTGTEALFCESGVLRAIPCSGAGGCTTNSSQVVCDFSRAKAGDACPAANNSQAQCNAADANGALKCTSGTWQALACKACAVQSGSVVCQP